MRMLLELDRKDYDENGTCCVRPSVRGIIIKDGKIAMVHSLKYDYYKFPGGGVEQDEEHQETLIREVKEEVGLVVIPDSIREFGLVHRIQKGKVDDMFVQDNYYYFCDVEPEIVIQKLDEYEEEEQFTLEYVLPQYAIDTNRFGEHGTKNDDPLYSTMIEREVYILEMLMQESYC